MQLEDVQQVPIFFVSSVFFSGPMGVVVDFVVVVVVVPVPFALLPSPIVPIAPARFVPFVYYLE